MTGIASLPLGRWFLGEEHDRAGARGYVRRAERSDKLPVLVAYNIWPGLRVLPYANPWRTTTPNLHDPPQPDLPRRQRGTTSVVRVWSPVCAVASASLGDV
ncbi:MAG TPA: hypothetical protein VIL34_15035 [Actinopolymorphaceae bacterium]|jgi:hypothetical protein